MAWKDIVESTRTFTQSLTLGVACPPGTSPQSNAEAGGVDLAAIRSAFPSSPPGWSDIATAFTCNYKDRVHGFRNKALLIITNDRRAAVLHRSGSRTEVLEYGRTRHAIIVTPGKEQIVPQFVMTFPKDYEQRLGEHRARYWTDLKPIYWYLTWESMANTYAEEGYVDGARRVTGPLLELYMTGPLMRQLHETIGGLFW